MEYVLTIIAILCTLVAISICYYQSVKKKIEEEALDAINKAEDTDKTGEEKMREAVATVYGMIPIIAKPFINEKVIEAIIQSIFNKVEEYAKKQVEKKQEQI